MADNIGTRVETAIRTGINSERIIRHELNVLVVQYLNRVKDVNQTPELISYYVRNFRWVNKTLLEKLSMLKKSVATLRSSYRLLFHNQSKTISEGAANALGNLNELIQTMEKGVNDVLRVVWQYLRALNKKQRIQSVLPATLESIREYIRIADEIHRNLWIFYDFKTAARQSERRLDAA